ncbi:hypothetical protein LCGC14_2929100 [marine sediment metagenome]|uniref:Uncharacterized protein n=1 Tax=marine sediment metagenome TaxID=412755 RepID=A0A0F9ACL5_9ZZZZ
MRLVKTPYLKTPLKCEERGVKLKNSPRTRAIPMSEQAHQELVTLFENKLYLRSCPRCATGAVELEPLIPERGHRLSCMSCGFSVETSSGPVLGKAGPS